MNRHRLVGLVLVLLAVSWPSFPGYGQVVGGGSCTNYGCIMLSWMAPHDFVLKQHYCMQFPIPTGRLVLNAQGVQGGYPVSTGGVQQVMIGAASCATCTVPPGTNTAIEGSPAIGLSVLQSFGNYVCHQ